MPSSRDWDSLIERFEMSHRRVMRGRRTVHRQEQLVDRLHKSGQDITAAKRQLELFKDTLRLIEENFNMLKKQLEDWKWD
jgi:Mg2+ and Co2+ transporter CorA